MRLPVILVCVLLLLSQGSALTLQPRLSIPFRDINNMKQFSASGANMSSMLIREDLGQLVVGGRGKVYSLDLFDISVKTSETDWMVTKADKARCQRKGKDAEDCSNYIMALHTTKDSNFLVCGTNAFDPKCDFMTFENGRLHMKGKLEGGKGKVPFDPNRSQTSLMVDDNLFSATTSNFLGTLAVFQQTGPNPLKTEMKQSWFNDPTFVSVKLLERSGNEDGEDDSVFLFFTETAVEEHLGTIQVSRIARVCKGDMGGRRTLQRKWTSFLKARLHCPLAEPGVTSLVQDVFLLQDHHNWRDSLFYATFTSDPETSKICRQSAVCAYKMSDISAVFRGEFLTEEHSGRWDSYTGEVPVPRPGSCINDDIRATGVTTSLDLPDKTLLFIKDHPLMENMVRPLTGKPVFTQTETRFSKIVVDRVTALDGVQHDVMFIGTDSGWLQKAAWYREGHSHIVEELQLFKTPQPIRFLQLSSITGQLYAGSQDVVVQVNTNDCSRYTSCSDCVLAQDPYCGWDYITDQCTTVAGALQWSMFQILRDGDISMCPADVEEKPITVHLNLGMAHLITCTPELNMPVSWSFPKRVVLPSDRHFVTSQGLLITRAKYTDAGLYSCQTEETIKGIIHRHTVVEYRVVIHDIDTVIIHLTASLIVLTCVLIYIEKQWRRIVFRPWLNRLLHRTGCSRVTSNIRHVVVNITPALRGPDDQDDSERVDEPVTTQDSASSIDESCTTEGVGSTETWSSDYVIVLPEGSATPKAEEEERGLNNHNNNDYVVIEIPE